MESGLLSSEMEIVNDEPVGQAPEKISTPGASNLIDVDPSSYRPVVSHDGVWTLSEIDMGKMKTLSALSSLNFHGL